MTHEWRLELMQRDASDDVVRGVLAADDEDEIEDDDDLDEEDDDVEDEDDEDEDEEEEDEDLDD